MHRNRVCVFFAIASANFHRRPEITISFWHTLEQGNANFQGATACDFILRIPSENRILSREFLCDSAPAKENRCDCDLRFWCAQGRVSNQVSTILTDASEKLTG